MMMTSSMEGRSDMRRSIYCLLAVLGTVAACNREAIDSTEETEKPGSTAKTVTVFAGGAGTRTSIRHENDKYVVGWKAGDKLAVLEGIPGLASLLMDNPDLNAYAAETYESEPLAEDTDNAVFTLNLKERDYTSGLNHYVAIYPASAAIPVYDPWDYEKQRLYATIDFPRLQKPTADSFDPEADVLVSKVVTQMGRPSTLSFEFARVGTIVKMILNGLPEGVVLESGYIELGIESGYYMMYDPVDQKMIGSDGTDGISFSWENGLVVGPDRAVTVWLRCMSGISDSIYFELYGTNPKSGEFERVRRINLRAKGRTLEFKEGGLTTFTVDLRAPDVANPAEDEIDFRTTTADHDGVEVFWPVPANPNLAGYECFLRDEDGNRHDFTSTVNNGTLFKASIGSGLAPGTYMLFVRALAVDGKVSQQDFVEKELEIGLPVTLNLSYMSSHNPSLGDEFDLDLDYSYGQTDRDLYRGFYFYLRNLEWHGGSPNHFDGFTYNNLAWGVWNDTPAYWAALTLKTVSGYNASNYSVYASDSIFTDGNPGSATSITGATTDEGTTYNLGNKRYFLILGAPGVRLHIDQISLDYYK